MKIKLHPSVSGGGLFLLVLSLSATAQLAPVAGSHYAARASDTGFAGVSSTNGGYATSIPIDLPEAQGLPIPLQVVSGGNRIGAAGLGWDIPLSYIKRSKTAAYRRPAPAADASSLRAPELLTLVLNGESIELVRDGSAWAARRNNAQLRVREVGNGSLEAYDGDGRKYSFNAQAGCSGCVLDSGNFYLLRNISGPGGTNLHFEYSISTPNLPSGGTGIAVDVKSVRWGLSPDGACSKYQVNLIYDAPATAPLSMSVLGGTVLARMDKLSAIDVTARSANEAPDSACKGATKSLRKYSLTYANDVDTGQPRLKEVTMVGQQDTPERSVKLPVASYRYGSLSGDGEISFVQMPDASPPRVGGSRNFSLGVSYTDGVIGRSDGDFTAELTTTQGLIDVTGDGLPDLFTEESFYQNVPSATSTFGLVRAPLAQGTGPALLREMTVTRAKSSGFSRTSSGSTNDKTRQLIDMNGDGRIDIVETQGDAANWTVQLNLPDPTLANQSIFVPVRIPTQQLQDAVGVAGPLPLSRSTTVQELPFEECWFWNRNGGGFPRWESAGNEFCTPAARPDNGRRKTIVEFELKDVNGDGYPDFVYNASRVRSDRPDLRPTVPGTLQGEMRLTSMAADIRDSRDVMVMLNTAGTHLANGVPIFSAPIVFEAGGATGCGVARWEADPSSADGGIMNQVCSIEDVNGDGIADRVKAIVQNGVIVGQASLGTGDLSRPVASGATITLPGPLARTETELVRDPAAEAIEQRFTPQACVAHATTYDSRRTSGLRDINGDGIPDFIDHLPPNGVLGDTWLVYFGTGVGYSSAVQVDSPFGLELSRERSICGYQRRLQVPTFNGGVGVTPSGLYDIDGDKQPEIVVLDKAAERWNVYSAKNLSAGRLIAVANGYGAETRITYRSAKRDTSTRHAVPFAEIVVDSVSQTDAAGNELLAPTRFAYGGAELIFDAVSDVFRFPGYRRSISLRKSGAYALPQTDSVATVTDTYALEPFEANPLNPVDANSHARFLRYLKVGRTKDITTLSTTTGGSVGSVGDDPWTLLSVDAQRDERRIAGTHYDWDARLLPLGLNSNEYCLDMLYPYDFNRSNQYRIDHASDTFDQCAQRGFVFQTTERTYRGRPLNLATPNASVVMTEDVVVSVDDLGRVTQTLLGNDVFQTDDNVCITTTYASPPPGSTAERVLNAPAVRTVSSSCDPGSAPALLSNEKWEYDTNAAGQKLPFGQVTNGFVTAHIVSRLDMDTQASLGDIRQFDATYNATGNPLTVTRIRNDGATHKTTNSYDAFGLVLTASRTDATNADGSSIPATSTLFARDPVTLQTLSVTDPNGMVIGSTYDGFGRLLLSKAKQPGGAEGVLSSLTYRNFASGSSGQRNIVQKVFANAVPANSVATAAGRTSTVHIDSLGRQTKTELELGADYQNSKLISAQRTYDALGRVRFEADTYPATETPGTVYGTTSFFNADGTLLCSVRAKGEQAVMADRSDEVNEVYPTCYNYNYFNSTLFASVADASAFLSGSAQESTSRGTYYSAIGRPLVSVVQRSARRDRAVLERIKYAYNALGHQTQMIRYKDPVAVATEPSAGSNALTVTRHYDSLGWMTRLEEQGIAPKNYTFDTWGKVTQVQWCDDNSSGPCPAADRRSVTQYDALGRPTHREDRSGGVLVPETANDYTYDVGVNSINPPVTMTNVLGRLATATSPTSRVSFSYDAFGRIGTKVFTDGANANEVYVEKHERHDDGSEKTLHFLLSDNAFQDEKVDYTYDSAGRARSAIYNDGASQSLFNAVGSANIDVFGRLRNAQYGAASFTANYADTGRRLISDVLVASAAPLRTSRRISFAPLPGTSASVTAFDPMGRERVRTETRNDEVTSTATLSDYDAKGRLSATSRSVLGIGGAVLSTGLQQQFAYDALGNTTLHEDLSAGTAGASTVRLMYPTTEGADRDRLCSVAYAGAAAPGSCNTTYDGAGNTLTMPARNGQRSLTWLPGGNVKTITAGNANATFKYDAFGDLQQLLMSTTSAVRRDKHFGDLILRHDEAGASVVARRVRLPGMVATRHGPRGGWTFAFGESRGNRFVTDQNGAFVQDMSYQAYGEVASSGASPGTVNYSSVQWNGGDVLEDLGLVHLGARVYDPVVGRFLSRDPLFDPGNINPYAFVANDPVNNVDPTGKGCSGGLCIDNGGESQPGGGPPVPGGPGPDYGPGLYPDTAGGSRPCPHGCSTGGHNGGGQRPPQGPHTSTTSSNAVPNNPGVLLTAAQNAFQVGKKLPGTEIGIALFVAESSADLHALGVLNKLGPVHNVVSVFNVVENVSRVSDATINFARNPSIGSGAGVALEGLKIAIEKHGGYAGAAVAGGLNYLQDHGYIYQGFIRDLATPGKYRSTAGLAEFGAEEDLRRKAHLEFIYLLHHNDVSLLPTYGPEERPANASYLDQ